MTISATVIRAISTVHVRKWAAAAVDPMTGSPVPPGVTLPAPPAPSPVDATPPVPGSTQPAPVVPPAAAPATPSLPAPSGALPPVATPPTTPPVPAMPPVAHPAPATPSTAAVSPASPAAGSKPSITDSLLNIGKHYANKALSGASNAITAHTNTAVDEQLGSQLDGLKAMPDQTVMSTAGDLFSDPRNWAVPVGMLLTLFGGSTGKLLGGLMMGGGAVDLYQRYKGVEGLGATPQGQNMVKQLLTFKDPTGKPMPFGNLQEMMKANPEQARALQDFNLATKIGLKNQIQDKLINAGIEQGKQYGTSPQTIIGRLVATKRLSESQGQEMLAKTQAAQQRLAAQTAPVPAPVR